MVLVLKYGTGLLFPGEESAHSDHQSKLADPGEGWANLPSPDGQHGRYTVDTWDGEVGIW